MVSGLVGATVTHAAAPNEGNLPSISVEFKSFQFRWLFVRESLRIFPFASLTIFAIVLWNFPKPPLANMLKVIFVAP